MTKWWQIHFIVFTGGENIREMIRQTGAHVELDRNPPPNMNEKLFNIRGNPNQIQAAIAMIQEKTGQQGGPNDQVIWYTFFPTFVLFASFFSQP